MSYQELYDKALQSNKVENMTPKFIEFGQSGEKIIGRFIARHLVQSSSNDGEYNQYLFDSDLGLVKFHLGSATDKEAGNLFVENRVYAIEYLGKEKISNTRSVNKFKIEKINLMTSVEN